MVGPKEDELLELIEDLKMALGIESAVLLLYRGLIPNTDLPFLVGVKRGAN